MSVIDTLSAGFNMVTRRLWLIIIPVLLDLYLWLGPRLSISPLIERALPLLRGPLSASEIDYQTLAEVRQMLEQMGEESNLLSFLVSNFLGVPSLMATSGPLSTFLERPQAIVSIDNGWVFVGLFVLLTLCGLLIGCFYLGLIAHQVHQDPLSPLRLLGRVWLYWVRLIAFGLLLIVAGLTIGLPVSLVTVFAALLNQRLAIFMITLFILSVGWVSILVFIYLFFVTAAIVLNEVGIWQAMANSVGVVRRNFWSTIGLIVLIKLIGRGLFLVWDRLNFNPWGTLIGILGSAYIGSGLAAASLIFYQDRYTKWQEALSESTD